MKKIENIMQAFRVLSTLKVKEVVLPHREYLELKDLVRLYFLNDSSHNSQEKFEESTTMSIYGVQIKSERSPKYEKIDYCIDKNFRQNIKFSSPDEFAFLLKKKITPQPHTPRDELDD